MKPEDDHHERKQVSIEDYVNCVFGIRLILGLVCKG